MFSKFNHRDSLNEAVCSPSLRPLVHEPEGFRVLDDHQLVPVSAELFQRLSHHNSTADARGLLECALISGYEEAIQNGLPPLDALSMILNWVAGEIARLHHET